MNIVTPQPAINLNTANVYTETARRDNLVRETIPKAPAIPASLTENKYLSDGDKNKSSSLDDSGLYDNPKHNNDNQKIDGDNSDGGHKHPSGGHDQQAQQQHLEELEIQELESRDREVRLHEQAHAAVGGPHAGSPSYEYQYGPDGRSYAVGGEVMIDVSEVTGDPQATIEKMQTVRAAALAPANPSGADRAIAAEATKKIAAAQAELTKHVIFDSDEAHSSHRVDENDGYEGRRLNEAQVNTTQTENKVLSSEQQVLGEANRDTLFTSRAKRINEYYQHATEPYSPASFQRQV
jgi:hypothetical protein